MKKATIFVEPEIWDLLSRVAKEEEAKGRRVTKSELIREAVRRYLSEMGYPTEERAEKIRRAISVFGALGADFENRVSELRSTFDKWNPDSA